jgi:hypothetical protein
MDHASHCSKCSSSVDVARLEVGLNLDFELRPAWLPANSAAMSDSLETQDSKSWTALASIPPPRGGESRPTLQGCLFHKLYSRAGLWGFGGDWRFERDFLTHWQSAPRRSLRSLGADRDPAVCKGPLPRARPALTRKRGRAVRYCGNRSGFIAALCSQLDGRSAASEKTARLGAREPGCSVSR